MLFRSLPVFSTITVIFDTLDHIKVVPGLNFVCLCSRPFQQLLEMQSPWLGKMGIWMELSHAGLQRSMVRWMGRSMRMQSQQLQGIFEETYEFFEFQPNRLIIKQRSQVLAPGFRWPNIHDIENPYINRTNIEMIIDLGNADNENRGRFYDLNSDFRVNSCGCQCDIQ